MSKEPDLEETLGVLSVAVAAIERITQLVHDVRLGKVNPADAKTALGLFGYELAKNNAAADAALDAKFPTGGEDSDP